MTWKLFIGRDLSIISNVNLSGGKFSTSVQVSGTSKLIQTHHFSHHSSHYCLSRLSLCLNSVQLQSAKLINQIISVSCPDFGLQQQQQHRYYRIWFQFQIENFMFQTVLEVKYREESTSTCQVARRDFKVHPGRTSTSFHFLQVFTWFQLWLF